MNFYKLVWGHSRQVPTKGYVCGFCGESMSSQLGFTGSSDHGNIPYIYICHVCTYPTFFIAGEQTPKPKFGQNVKHIPDPNVEKLYEEARNCYSVAAYTSSVMCSRKLLMNIAVSEGAKEGCSFTDYVTYLEKNNFVPPKGKVWVDEIRKIGNEANHKIEFKTQESAFQILTFTEMLLKFIYEMPGILESSNKTAPSAGK